MTEGDDLLGMMGITPSSFRVVADYDVGAVVVEISYSETKKLLLGVTAASHTTLKMVMTPSAADQLARALTTVRRRILDRRLLEDEEPT